MVCNMVQVGNYCCQPLYIHLNNGHIWCILHCMKIVRTEDAVGMVLCHDVTEIVKDARKGPAFRKGHIIRKEDVPKLLDLGKKNIYVYENDGSMLHEDEAARILEKITKGDNLAASLPKEGKIELTATIDGLFVDGGGENR